MFIRCVSGVRFDYEGLATNPTKEKLSESCDRLAMNRMRLHSLSLLADRYQAGSQKHTDDVANTTSGLLNTISGGGTEKGYVTRRWALHRGRFYLDSVVRAGRVGLPSLSPVPLGKVSLRWSDP
jgi:hypothetical protein